jgi:hypothetical protein
VSRVSDVAVRVATDASPRFVMVGVELPNGKVRLYASRDVPPRQLSWGMRDVDYTSVWHVDAAMMKVLVIDADDWAAAFARAFEIWGNHDRAEREGKQNALAASESRSLAGHGSIARPAPAALPPGSTPR